MSNQLVLPFRAASPTDIKEAVLAFIKDAHPEIHPDAFQRDIAEWESLRAPAVSGGVHVTRVPAYLNYHAQLVFILTKLPPDIGLRVKFDTGFSEGSPITLRDLCYERLCILYNLASLYCHLAAGQDKSNVEGIRVATHYYQQAAGTLSYLMDSALPQLQASQRDPLPPALSLSLFQTFQWLMLVQAQECALEKAVKDNLKSSTLARLAMKASTYCRTALSFLEAENASAASVIPPEWKVHLRIKSLYYEAFAQQRKSFDDNESGRYGEEVGRLEVAARAAVQARDLAKRSRGISKSVKEETQLLAVAVEKELASATRDNDFIYHKDVVAESSLAVIQGIELVKSMVPASLLDPAQIVRPGGQHPLFSELLADGTRLAIEIYKDRATNYVRREILSVQSDLDSQIVQTLQRLKLPAAIEALNRSVGLPPSLLAKCNEVREQGGNQQIHSATDSVATLAKRSIRTIDEGYAILEAEADEDEEFQTKYPSRRPTSHQANNGLTDQLERYRKATDTATGSDQLIADAWAQWYTHIDMLCKPEAEIDALVPSHVTAKDTSTTATQTYSRNLRTLLEQLDDLKQARADDAARAKRILDEDVDETRQRITREATAVERWVEIKPAMFEDTIADELDKYSIFKDRLAETKLEQDGLLDRIEATNDVFLNSRKDDPAIGRRREMFQALDQAYNNYRDIVKNLSEANTFYNQLAAVSSELTDSCRLWAQGRSEEVLQWAQSAAVQPVAEQSPIADQLYTTSLLPPSPVTTARPSNPTPIAASSGSTPLKLGATGAVGSQALGYKPRSNFVKQALASPGPSRPKQARAPSPPQKRPVMMNAYAKDITSADDWEDTPAPSLVTYAPELGNLDSDGWDDGPDLDAIVLPPPPLTPAGKKTNSKKTVAMPATPSSAPSGSERATRSRGRVPAS